MSATVRTPVVAAQGLRLTYRRHGRRTAVQALAGVDIEVQAGEIVGVLGPNGSGKTTLLEILAGVRRGYDGSARVLGRAPTDRALVARVGFQPAGALPFPMLSGPELLRYLGSLMGLPGQGLAARIEARLAELGLGDIGRRRTPTLSTGMARRLAIAAALLPDPDLLLLDEPTAGIDPEGSLRILELIQQQAARGGAVLLSSHQLQEVEQICDRVYLLEQGRIAAAGTLDALLGTGDRSLVVRGLVAEKLPQIGAAIEAEGGELVRIERARQHLFAWFRSPRDGTAGEP